MCGGGGGGGGRGEEGKKEPPSHYSFNFTEAFSSSLGAEYK